MENVMKINKCQFVMSVVHSVTGPRENYSYL